MTALHSLDPSQQTFLACGLTCLLGLFLGALWAWLVVRPRDRRPILPDLGVDEYVDACDLTPTETREWDAIEAAVGGRRLS